MTKEAREIELFMKKYKDSKWVDEFLSKTSCCKVNKKEVKFIR